MVQRAIVGGGVRAPDGLWPTTPYVGVTGVESTADVDLCGRLVELLPATHVLMAGVLVRESALLGDVPAKPRYPALDAVPGLLRALRDVGAWPVVHYCVAGKARDFPAERKAVALLRDARGWQLNVDDALSGWASVTVTAPTIVQWRFQAASEDVAARGARTVARAARSRGADFVLLDASQGRGVPMHAETARGAMHGWALHAADAGSKTPRLALAGGLGPDAAPVLREACDGLVPAAFEGVSLDAESGVRTADGSAIDPGRATAWVELAGEFLLGGLRP